MRYETSYKGFRLAVEKTEKGWQPHVIVEATGEALSDVQPGPEGEVLLSPKLVAYPLYLTLAEAQEKACREATLRADRVEKTCAEAGIEWLQR